MDAAAWSVLPPTLHLTRADGCCGPAQLSSGPIFTHTSRLHIHAASSPVSRTLQCLLKPSRGDPKDRPSPLLVSVTPGADGYFNPAWHGPAVVSELTSECSSLIQTGTAHTLPWLSCMPMGAVALLGKVCPQSHPLNVLAGVAA